MHSAARLDSTRSLYGARNRGGSEAAIERFAPAGVPPPAEYGPGIHGFRTAILCNGAEPMVAGDFRANFTRALQEIVGGAATSEPSTSLTKGAREGTDTATTGYKWWVTVITGMRVHTRIATDDLNRAIARAFANTVRWTGYQSARMIPKLPRDGAELHRLLQTSGACEGLRRSQNVIEAACTRHVSESPAPAAPRPAVPHSTPPAPPTPPTPRPTAVTPPAPAQPSTGLCTVRVQSPFWLRPRPTFDRIGPRFQAGTDIGLLARTDAVQGSLRLFRVRVMGTGQEGYAALEFEDTRTPGAGGCPNPNVPPETVSQGMVPAPPSVPSGPSPTPSVPSLPPRTTVPETRGPAPSVPAPSRREEESKFPWGYAVGGVAAAGIVGVAIANRKKIARLFR